MIKVDFNSDGIDTRKNTRNVEEYDREDENFTTPIMNDWKKVVEPSILIAVHLLDVIISLYRDPFLFICLYFSIKVIIFSDPWLDNKFYKFCIYHLTYHQNENIINLYWI